MVGGEEKVNDSMNEVMDSLPDMPTFCIFEKAKTVRMTASSSINIYYLLLEQI